MKRNMIMMVTSLFVLWACNPKQPNTQLKNEETQKETTVKVEKAEDIPDPYAPEKVSFESDGGITVYANLYHISDDAPVIVLCHQARFNKFEYREIAPKLNEMGFNCLAIDQRSGGTMFLSIRNETAYNAFGEGDGKVKNQNDRISGFLSAEPDIINAVDYAYKKYKRNVILWGSSYSATLALYQALENQHVDAVIAFSPGNYFDEKKGSLSKKLSSLNKPMFVTSSLEESEELSNLLSLMKPSEKQVQFIPQGTGYHGSRALWLKKPGNEEYWSAISDFLYQIYEKK